MPSKSVDSKHAGGIVAKVHELPEFLPEGSSPPRGQLRGGHARTPETTSYPPSHRTSRGHVFEHLPRVEEGLAKSKGPHHKHDSAVALPDAAVVKDSKRNSLTQRPKRTSPTEKKAPRRSPPEKKTTRPSPPEKVRTPGLVVHRHKRASTSSLPPALPSLPFERTSLSSRDSPASHGRDHEIRPSELRPSRRTCSPSSTSHTEPSSSTDQPTTTTTMTTTAGASTGTNPKLARVRAGRLTPLTPLTIPTSIPVTVSLPGSDHPVTAMGTITLPQGALQPGTMCALSRQGTSSTASAPIGTNLARFKHLIDADLARWGYIERELGKRDVPVDALSTEQMGELMSEKSASRLQLLLDELEKVQMADAFEHVTSPMGDAENPKLYSFRYSHGQPLGGVYTYRPPSYSSLSGRSGSGGAVQKKTIKELVRDGKVWGKRNRYARVCRLGYAVLAGVGIIGGVVAVCYFRVGQIANKKGFAHES